MRQFVDADDCVYEAFTHYSSVGLKNAAAPRVHEIEISLCIPSSACDVLIGPTPPGLQLRSTRGLRSVVRRSEVREVREAERSEVREVRASRDRDKPSSACDVLIGPTPPGLCTMVGVQLRSSRGFRSEVAGRRSEVREAERRRGWRGSRVDG